MNLKNKTAALVLAALMLLPTAVTNAAASDVRESALSVEDIPTVTQGETLFYTVTLGSEETEFSFKTESLYKPVANTSVCLPLQSRGGRNGKCGCTAIARRLQYAVLYL